MADLTFKDLALIDIENAQAFVAYLENWNASIEEGETGQPLVDLSSFMNMPENYGGGYDSKTSPANINFCETPGIHPSFCQGGAFDLEAALDPDNPAWAAYAPYTGVTSVEFILWTYGDINRTGQSDLSQMEITGGEGSEQYQKWQIVKQNGFLTLFQRVAFILSTHPAKPANYNVLKEALGEDVYEDFLNVDTYKYLLKEPQSDYQTSVLRTVFEDPLSWPYEGQSGFYSQENRAVTYLDFLAFIYKFPHIFALGKQREDIIDILKAGGTTANNFLTDSDGSSQFAKDLQKFIFSTGIPTQDYSFAPDPLVPAATHYIRHLSTTDL